MQTCESNLRFDAAVATLYQELLVPLIFEAYALATWPPGLRRCRWPACWSACGRHGRSDARAGCLAGAGRAAGRQGSRRVDAQGGASQGGCPCGDLAPAGRDGAAFDDASFDAVVCQFGAMFFADPARVFAELRRVLRPRGTFLSNVGTGSRRTISRGS
jgi:hypothetical protein